MDTNMYKKHKIFWCPEVVNPAFFNVITDSRGHQPRQGEQRHTNSRWCEETYRWGHGGWRRGQVSVFGQQEGNHRSDTSGLRFREGEANRTEEETSQEVTKKDKETGAQRPAKKSKWVWLGDAWRVPTHSKALL